MSYHQENEETSELPANLDEAKLRAGYNQGLESGLPPDTAMPYGQYHTSFQYGLALGDAHRHAMRAAGGDFAIGSLAFENAQERRLNLKTMHAAVGYLLGEGAAEAFQEAVEQAQD